MEQSVIIMGGIAQTTHFEEKVSKSCNKEVYCMFRKGYTDETDTDKRISTGCASFSNAQRPGSSDRGTVKI